MISVRTENGRTKTEIHCKGLKNVVADTAVILKAIHEAVKEINEDAAKEFEFYLDELTKDGIMFHEDRMQKEIEQMMQEKNESSKIHEDLAKSIAEALKLLKEALEDESDE